MKVKCVFIVWGELHHTYPLGSHVLALHKAIISLEYEAFTGGRR